MNAVKRTIGRRGPNVDGVTYLEWYCEPTTSDVKADFDFVALDIIACPMVKIGDERFRIGLEFVATVTILRDKPLTPRGRMDMVQIVDDICTELEQSRDAVQ